jgi:chitinase
MLASMGVPGYAVSSEYNYFAFSFWTYGSGPVDVAKAWAQPSVYMSWLGTNTSQIQKTIKNAFNSNNKKLMLSAFGSTENPTSQGYNPTDVAIKLADFVNQNNFDGVDIDYEDNAAMEAGTG